MSESNCYIEIDKEEDVKDFLNSLRDYSIKNNKQIYVIDRPLGEKQYSYAYKSGFALLAPKNKIVFIDYGKNSNQFAEYVEDFCEDLASLSDKYRYKEVIGRARNWMDLKIERNIHSISSLDQLFRESKLEDKQEQRKSELLISLLTGSINDIDKTTVDNPKTILEKIKKKIILFDGDQTRFIYSKIDKKEVRIQGLSGTGKTELLLHKLKELYVGYPNAKIAFTCHNKILSDSLRKRIPQFFDFMKVEQQILWNERLFCVHAWGSQHRSDSGIYRYICHHYNLQFRPFSIANNFESVCNLAIEELEKTGRKDPLFDYMLIDESQDFPDSFFKLCSKVTKDTVYIAGDIFQSIFDENIVASVETDFLLSKCYRTDPRTLMFSHSVGMGLFENKKLRWLEDKEWEHCGYKIQKEKEVGLYKLKREPLRRFEDIDQSTYSSVEIKEITGEFYDNAPSAVVSLVKQILAENETATIEDIGIILLDSNKASYSLADKISHLFQSQEGISCNKAYETKTEIPGHLFISNKNNVKGLEFPFVICLTDYIQNGYSYRNAAYMTLTRSFIKAYFLYSDKTVLALREALKNGLKKINESGEIVTKEPTEEQKIKIRTNIQQLKKKSSLPEAIEIVFDELHIDKAERKRLRAICFAAFSEDFDLLELKRFVSTNSNLLKKG